MDELQFTPQGDNPTQLNAAPAEMPMNPTEAAPMTAPVAETPAPGAPISLSDAQPVSAEPAVTESVQPEVMPAEAPASMGSEAPAEASAAPEVPAMPAAEAELPKKGGLLKIALIAGAIVVVVGAAGAAIFLGKGGPFKGQLAVTELTNAPIRFAAGTEQTLCPTDEYKPMLSGELLTSSIPKANAQAFLQNLKNISPATLDAPLTNSLFQNNTTPPPIIVHTMTQQTQPPLSVQSTTLQLAPLATCTAISISPSQLNNGQTALRAKVTYSDGKSYSTVVTWTGEGGTYINSTIQEQQSSSDFVSTFATSTSPASATAKVTAVTGANNSPVCQTGVTVNTPPPVLVQTATIETVETTAILPPPPLIETSQTAVTDSCDPIPHDNLVPGGDQCILIDSLYGSPDSYLLNDETKSHLNAWYSTCHPPVETTETLVGTTETMPVPPITQAVLECGQNEVLNDAVCVCAKGYTRNGDTELCEYDCAGALDRINSLKSSPTTASTPEALSELLSLQSAYGEFGCEAPPTEEISDCKKFETAATDALNSGNFDTYLTSINLYIDNNCSGRTEGMCEAQLAKASAVNTVLSDTIESPSHAEYQAQLTTLRDQYYANGQCYDPGRCAQLEPIYGSQQTSEGASLQSSPDVVQSLVPVYLQLTPGNIFNDDQQYYNEQCKPLSCDQIRAKYTGVDLDSLDITAETRASYAACLVVPEPTPTIESPISTPPPAPPAPPSGGGGAGGRPPGYVPPAPPTPPTIVSPIISPPTPPPAVTPAAVTSETTAIEPAKAPTPPAPTFPIKTVIPPAPAPAPAVHPAAPEAPKPVVKNLPPEVTPTGPEVYIYLIGFMGIQLFLFRRKILAWVMERSK